MANDIKLPYGLLNPVEKEKFTTRANTNKKDSLEYMREAAFETLYSPTIKPDGNYIGFVLMVDKAKKSFSSFDRIWDIASPDDTRPNIGTAKVRIPEIHSMIREPSSFEDRVHIDLHHSFEYNIDEINEISQGDLVEVVMYDGQSRFRPRILRKLKGKLALDKPTDPQGAFDNGGNYQGGGSTPPLSAEPHPYQKGKTTVEILPGKPWPAKSRIRVTSDGIRPLDPSSPLLVPVTTHPVYGQQRMHVLAAKRFEALVRAAADDGFEIAATSGYRRPKYEETFAEYKKRIMKQYVFEKGGKFHYTKWLTGGRTKDEAVAIAFKRAKGTLAYGPKSPHNTGCAVDLIWEGYNHGEVDVRASKPGGKREIVSRKLDGSSVSHKAWKYGSTMHKEMRKTSFHKWMEENAWKYGCTPLLNEAWHWEFHMPIESFITGEEFTNDFGVRVVEKGVNSGIPTTRRDFRY